MCRALISSVRSESVAEHYEIEFTIGEGGFGKVMQACCRISGASVAIKQCLHTEDEDQQAMCREAEIMMGLEHPNICRCLGFSCSEPAVQIVMELLYGGDLEGVIRTNPHGLQERCTALVLRQIGAGIHFAHLRGVAHRDLKPENIGFADTNQQAVKLIDWGCACRFSTSSCRGSNQLSQRMQSIVGTATYAAPEVLEMDLDLRAMYGLPSTSKGYTCACDTWSWGIVAFELLMGDLPFDNLSDIREAHVDFRATSLTSCCRDFVIGLLQRDACARMSIEEALCHTFLAQVQACAAPNSGGLCQSSL